LQLDTALSSLACHPLTAVVALLSSDHFDGVVCGLLYCLAQVRHLLAFLPICGSDVYRQQVPGGVWHRMDFASFALLVAVVARMRPFRNLTARCVHQKLLHRAALDAIVPNE